MSARSCGWSNRRSTSREAVQRARLLRPRPGGRRARRAWIFTSATLGDDARLRWFTEPCGLERRRGAAGRQPVRLRQRRPRVYVPRDLAEAERSGPQRSRWRCSRPRGAQRLGGRTMVLTTTLRALRAIGDAMLQRALRGPGSSSRCWCRASGPSGALMERFREGAARGGRAACWWRRPRSGKASTCPGDALQLRGDRQAAVPAARTIRWSRRASQRLEVAGPQRLQRVLRCRGGGVAQAGRRPPDPARIRSGRAGGLRHRAWRRWATAGACWPRCRRCAGSRARPKLEARDRLRSSDARRALAGAHQSFHHGSSLDRSRA